MNLIKLLFLLFLFCPAIVFGQGEQKIDSLKINFGTSIEYSILFYNSNAEKSYNEKLTETFPFGLYIYLDFKSAEDSGVKLKPGLIFAYSELKAIQIGLYYYHYLFEKSIFGMFGVNIHKPMIEAHNGSSVYEGNNYLLGAILGYNTKSILAFSLGYYKRLSQNPYYERYRNFNLPLYLNHMVNFGVDVKY